MKENADTFVSSELVTQLIQARPDAAPKRRLVGLEFGEEGGGGNFLMSIACVSRVQSYFITH